MRKIFTSILFICFLLTAMFGCALALKSVLSGEMTECCYMHVLQDSYNDNHNAPFILSNNNLLQVIIFVVFLFFAVRNKSLNNFSFRKYYLAIRDRYGGFNSFNKFILLFSKGILHPKIY